MGYIKFGANRGWINVENEVPELKQDVLVALKNKNSNDMFTTTAYRPEGEHRDWIFVDPHFENDEFFRFECEVIAWQPIPEPPKMSTSSQKETNEFLYFADINSDAENQISIEQLKEMMSHYNDGTTVKLDYIDKNGKFHFKRIKGDLS